MHCACECMSMDRDWRNVSRPRGSVFVEPGDITVTAAAAATTAAAAADVVAPDRKGRISNSGGGRASLLSGEVPRITILAA